MLYNLFLTIYLIHLIKTIFPSKNTVSQDTSLEMVLFRERLIQSLSDLIVVFLLQRRIRGE